MSEIKTCEQFVIAELEEARKTIGELGCAVAERDKVICESADRYNNLKRFIKFNAETHRFELSVWKQYDPKEYEELCQMFDIVELEEN